jgi:hypothetical protein
MKAFEKLTADIECNKGKCQYENVSNNPAGGPKFINCTRTSRNINTPAFKNTTLAGLHYTYKNRICTAWQTY